MSSAKVNPDVFYHPFFFFFITILGTLTLLKKGV